MAGENMSKKSPLPMTIANFQHPILINTGLQAGDGPVLNRRQLFQRLYPRGSSSHSQRTLSKIRAFFYAILPRKIVPTSLNHRNPAANIRDRQEMTSQTECRNL
jgi:hypothetical protein